jgi:PilZ domain
MSDARSERRKHRRYRAHFAVSIDAGKRTGRVGISQDVSAVGLLFNSRSRFEMGEEVTVTLLLRERPDDAMRVKGTVVRVIPVELRSSFPWRFMTAVSFQEPVPEIESSVKLRTARAS